MPNITEAEVSIKAVEVEEVSETTEEVNDECKSSFLEACISSNLEHLVVDSFKKLSSSTTTKKEYSNTNVENALQMLKGDSEFNFIPVKESVSKYSKENEKTVGQGFNLQLDAVNILDNETPCAFCDKFRVFDIDTDQYNYHGYLQHLRSFHNQYVFKEEEIYERRGYFIHWKNYLSKTSENIPCLYSFGTNQGNDKIVREMLKIIKIKKLLSWQDYERNDRYYQRPCFVCPRRITGTRHDFVNHLCEDHNVKLGNPQDLVNIHEFIDLLESEVKSNKCFHCSGVFSLGVFNHFKDVLNGNKRYLHVNKNNKEYDQFYLVNYLEPGKDWKDLVIRRGSNWRCPINYSTDEDEAGSFSGWTDKKELAICLICKHACHGVDRVFEHMKNEHRFDFKVVTAEMEYYDIIKMVNFIRRVVAYFQMLPVANIVDIVSEAIQEESNWTGQQLQPYKENDELVCCWNEKQAVVAKEVRKGEVDVHSIISNSELTSYFADRGCA